MGKWKKLLEGTQEAIAKLENTCRVAMQNLGIQGLIPELKKIVMNSDGSPKKLKEVIETLAEDEEQSNIITVFIRLEIASKNVDLQFKEANKKIEDIQENIFYQIEKNLEEIKKIVTPEDFRELRGHGEKGKGMNKRSTTRVQQQEKIDELKIRFQGQPEKLAFVVSFEDLNKRRSQELEREYNLQIEANAAQRGRLTPEQEALYKKLEKPVVYSQSAVLEPKDSPEPPIPAPQKAKAPPPIQVPPLSPTAIGGSPIEISNPTSPTGSQTSTRSTTPEPITPPSAAAAQQRAKEAEFGTKLLGAFEQHKQASNALSPKPTPNQPQTDKPPTPKYGK